MELFAVEIRTAQWQPMIEWYSSVLKLKSAVRSEKDGYALLVGEGWRLSLLRRLDDESYQRAAISLALEVDDLIATRDQIIPHLGESPPLVETSDEGFLQWTIADPDGNRIKLFQFVAADGGDS